MRVRELRNLDILARDSSYVPIVCGSALKDIVFSRTRQLFLTNSNVRMIRAYNNLLRVKGGLNLLEQLSNDHSVQEEHDMQQFMGSKCLSHTCEMVDAATRLPWEALCFRGEGECTFSGFAHKGEHKIYVWDRTKNLENMLEGPRETLVDHEWKPVQPIVFPISLESNHKGEILIVDAKSIPVPSIIPISSGSIKDTVFSRNWQFLLTNSSDRVIRIYKNNLAVKGAQKELEQLSNNHFIQGEHDRLQCIRSKCLTPKCCMADPITKFLWKAPCFSGDGEWVTSGSANKGEHKIYIWDRTSHLWEMLEGPREALIDLEWHPLHPIVVSVSLKGEVLNWAKDHAENGSSFAPDFKQFDEIEEYIEREDEFDINPREDEEIQLPINEDRCRHIWCRRNF